MKNEGCGEPPTLGTPGGSLSPHPESSSPSSEAQAPSEGQDALGSPLPSLRSLSRCEGAWPGRAIRGSPVSAP